MESTFKSVESDRFRAGARKSEPQTPNSEPQAANALYRQQEFFSRGHENCGLKLQA